MAHFVELTDYAYELYNGSGGHLILFLLCLMFFIFFPSDKTLREFVLFPSVACLVLFVFNPFFMGPMIDKVLGLGRTLRFYWLLPIDFLLAYLFARLISEQEVKKKRIKMAVVCVAALCLFGTPIFTKENFTIPENIYKVSNSTVEISNLLHKLSGDEPVYAVMPEEIYIEVRQFDATIKSPYARYGEKSVKGGSGVFKAMSEETLDFDYIGKTAAQLGCNFILIDNTKPFEGEMEFYEEKAKIDNLTIYQIRES